VVVVEVVDVVLVVLVDGRDEVEVEDVEVPFTPIQTARVASSVRFA
jgi:hypothetical protein